MRIELGLVRKLKLVGEAMREDLLEANSDD